MISHLTPRWLRFASYPAGDIYHSFGELTEVNRSGITLDLVPSVARSLRLRNGERFETLDAVRLDEEQWKLGEGMGNQWLMVINGE